MRYIVATAAIGLIFGFVFKYAGGGEPVGYATLFTLVALPLIGLLVTIDDDLPIVISLGLAPRFASAARNLRSTGQHAA